ncbi:MAG: hypothetical protein CUN53_12505 [Phototrophicales bacterium]|nr:MAG: hypothetical protein CUN53_12505 [Phototrophicales bacterium]
MDDGRVRVSCAGLCRIRDDDGRYLLALNYDRLTRGVRVYTPLGGGLEYHPPDLLARFDAEPENPGGRELRLYLPVARFPEFRMWFMQRIERETDPFRELREELVEELGVVEALRRSDVAFEGVRRLDAERVTDRSGAEGLSTRYLLEIFDVRFTSSAVRAALTSLPADGALRWITPTELDAGRTDDGADVEASALLEKS